MVFKNKLKNAARLLLGRRLWLSSDKSYKSERLGSDYGGWNVVTQFLNEDSIVYSFGLGDDISFDLSLIEQYGLVVHGFDPTPKSVHWINLQKLPDKFKFHKYGIYDFDGEISFNLPENPKNISFRISNNDKETAQSEKFNVKSLATIVDILGHDKIDVLKMDIEGSEYEVIPDLVKSSIKPKQILVEFHHKFKNRSLNDTKNLINLLKHIGYKVFFISDNQTDFGFILSTEK